MSSSGSSEISTFVPGFFESQTTTTVVSANSSRRTSPPLITEAEKIQNALIREAAMNAIRSAGQRNGSSQLLPSRVASLTASPQAGSTVNLPAVAEGPEEESVALAISLSQIPASEGAWVNKQLPTQ